MSLVEHMVNCGIMFAFVRFRNNKMDDDNNNKKSTHVMCLRGLIEKATIVQGRLDCLGRDMSLQASQASERTAGLGGTGSVLECLSFVMQKSSP